MKLHTKKKNNSREMITESVLNDNDLHDEKFNSTASIKKSYDERYYLLEKYVKSEDLNMF
jgi:hypothetical protein